MISGISPFCETFFTDAEVPKHRIFGEENRGWDVAKYLLTHERETISSGGAGLSGSGRALGQRIRLRANRRACRAIVRRSS